MTWLSSGGKGRWRAHALIPSSFPRQRLEGKRRLFQGYSAPGGFLPMTVQVMGGNGNGGQASPSSSPTMSPQPQAPDTKQAAELLTMSSRN